MIEGGGTTSVLNIPSSALWDSLRAGTASLQSTAPQLSHTAQLPGASASQGNFSFRGKCKLFFFFFFFFNFFTIFT